MQSDLVLTLSDLGEEALQNLKFLYVLEESNLLCVPRASSKESWRTFLIPEWSFDVFGCQEYIKEEGDFVCYLRN